MLLFSPFFSWSDNVVIVSNSEICTCNHKLHSREYHCVYHQRGFTSHSPLLMTHFHSGLLNHLKDWIMGKDLSSKIMIPRLIVGLLLSCHLLLQVIMEPAVQLRLPDFKNQKELGHLLCSLETRNFQETLVKLPIQGMLSLILIFLVFLFFPT